MYLLWAYSSVQEGGKTQNLEDEVQQFGAWSVVELILKIVLPILIFCVQEV